MFTVHFYKIKNNNIQQMHLNTFIIIYGSTKITNQQTVQQANTAHPDLKF
jgi:hypothetical protein